MNKLQLYSAATAAAVALLGLVGHAQGAYGTGTESFDSIRIGQAGVGGVTFFNGTIVNETKNAYGIDNPVVFGDSMRIDGRIWRGETQGPGDSLPIIIDDDLQVTGTITATNDIKLRSTSLIDKLNNHTSTLSSHTSTLSSHTSTLSDRYEDIDLIVSFLDCVKTFAQYTAYVESDDYGWCWNNWIAGEVVPAGISSSGVSASGLSTKNPLLQYQPEPPTDSQ